MLLATARVEVLYIFGSAVNLFLARDLSIAVSPVFTHDSVLHYKLGILASPLYFF